MTNPMTPHDATDPFATPIVEQGASPAATTGESVAPIRSAPAAPARSAADPATNMTWNEYQQANRGRQVSVAEFKRHTARDQRLRSITDFFPIVPPAPERAALKQREREDDDFIVETEVTEEGGDDAAEVEMEIDGVPVPTPRSGGGVTEEGGDDAAEVEMEIDGVPVPTPRSGGGIHEYFRPAPQTASAPRTPKEGHDERGRRLSKGARSRAQLAPLLTLRTPTPSTAPALPPGRQRANYSNGTMKQMMERAKALWEAFQQAPGDEDRPKAIVRIAREAGVHEIALRNRIDGKVGWFASAGQRCALGEAEELVVKHVKDMADRGFGYDWCEIEQLAVTVAARKRVPDFVASKQWRAGLQRRHPELTRRKAEALERTRAGAMNIAHIKHYMGILAQAHDDCRRMSGGVPLQASRILNMDETGFGLTKTLGWVVTAKGQNRAAFLKTGYQDHISLAAVVCANGDLIPPFFIMKGKKMPSKETLDGFPNDAHLALTDNAYATDKSHGEFIDHLIKHHCATRPDGLWSLLVMDGFTPHTLVPDGLLRLWDNKILAVNMPSHTSHECQPLDVGIFGPVKKKYPEALKKIQRQGKFMIANAEAALKKWKIPAIIWDVVKEAATPKVIISAFQKTGIFPYDKQWVERNIGKFNLAEPHRVLQQSKPGAAQSQTSAPTRPRAALEEGLIETTVNNLVSVMDSLRDADRQSAFCFDAKTPGRPEHAKLEELAGNLKDLYRVTVSLGCWIYPRQMMKLRTDVEMREMSATFHQRMRESIDAADLDKLKKQVQVFQAGAKFWEFYHLVSGKDKDDKVPADFMNDSIIEPKLRRLARFAWHCRRWWSAMIKNDRQKIPNMIHQDEWLPFDEAEREQAAAAAAKEQMIRRVQEQKFRAISQSVANEKRSSIVDALALDEKFRGVEAAEASIRDEANTRMDDILFVPEATTTKKRKGNGPKLNMIGESMATAKILNEPKRIRKLYENISKKTAAAEAAAGAAAELAYRQKPAVDLLVRLKFMRARDNLTIDRMKDFYKKNNVMLQVLCEPRGSQNNRTNNKTDWVDWLVQIGSDPTKYEPEAGWILGDDSPDVVQDRHAAYSARETSILVKRAAEKRRRCAAAVCIQRMVRGWRVRTALGRLNCAAVRIQAMVRDFQARRHAAARAAAPAFVVGQPTQTKSRRKNAGLNYAAFIRNVMPKTKNTEV
jgi:hypothetical protein